MYECYNVIFIYDKNMPFYLKVNLNMIPKVPLAFLNSILVNNMSMTEHFMYEARDATLTLK